MSTAAAAERAASPLRMSHRATTGARPASRVTLRRAVQTAARPSQVALAPPPVPSAVRPKLEIGPVDDPLEHEADRVADQVMRMTDPELSIGAAPTQISRTCAACGEEEKQKPQLKQEGDRAADQVMRIEGGPPPVTTSAPRLSRCCAACERQEAISRASAALRSDHAAADHAAETVRRGGTPPTFTFSSPTLAVSRKCAACKDEDEKKLQMKPAGAAVPAASVAPPLVHDALRASGRPLDPSTRAFMEPRLGHDFSHVRVHTEGLASRSADAVAARAYTVGPNIAFRSGEYAPGTAAGQRLLAHELAHVVQQGGAEPATLRRVHVDPTGRKQFDCPDYAGDPKLEACLNDEDRLRPGDRSETVAKVQRGLLSDGADLGPTGADGSYGPHTAQAVIAFKSKYQLGSEQYADVGPGTMAKLDVLGTSPGPTPPGPTPPGPTPPGPTPPGPTPPGPGPTPLCCPLIEADESAAINVDVSPRNTGFVKECLSSSETASKALDHAKQLNKQQDPGIWFDSWNNDLRDNNLNGLIDEPAEQIFKGRDGLHYKGVHSAKICDTAPLIPTDSSLCFSTSTIKVEYKVCIDIPLESYKAVGAPIPPTPTRNVHDLLIALQDPHGIYSQYWRVWKKPGLLFGYQDGDIVAEDRSAIDGHAGIVDGGWVINLPGPTTRRRYGVYTPSGKNDLIPVPIPLFKLVKDIDWVARLIKVPRCNPNKTLEQSQEPRA